MQTNSRKTVRRISPRTLGGTILIIALAGESYLMSLHTSAASGRSRNFVKPDIVQAVIPTPAVADLSDRSSPVDPADPQITALAAAAVRMQIPLGALKSNPFEQQQSVVTSDASAIPAPTKLNADERAAALKAVESLELRSILIADTHRSCVINDVNCEEGQQIDGFTIETISQASVTVSMGIYRFDLALAR